MHKVLWLFFLSLLFLFGGALQYLEIASPTETNLALLIIGTALIVKNFKLPKSSLAIYATLLCYTYIISLINNSTALEYIVYLYYISCSLIALILGAKFSTLAREEKLLQAVKIFLLSQATITTIQSIVTGSYFNKSQEIDLVSGSLFLSSDGALVACTTLLLIYIFNQAIGYYQKIAYTLVSLLIVTNCHSKAGLATFIVIASVLLTSLLFKKNARITIYPIAAIVGALFIASLYSDIGKIYSGFINELIYEFNKTTFNERAGRLTPLGQIFSGNISLFGEGFLTYYNPINKEWLYDSGFGTFYTLVIDAGIINAAAYTLISLYIIFKTVKTYNAPLVFLVFISYSFFNFSLSDMAFMFTLALVCHQIRPQQPYFLNKTAKTY